MAADLAQTVSASPSRIGSAVRAARLTLGGTIPDHYAGSWRSEFDIRVQASLHPNIRILDVGSGRSPTVTPEGRPPGCRYVGLDVSRAELEMAPPGSYDELVVSDVTERVPVLAESFDLILSFQVLEHVSPLMAAVENLRTYLRPGGRLLAHLSGTFSAFGLLNRVIPQRTSVWLVHRLLKRPAAEVFPAHYDQCWSSALERVFAPWSAVEVVPRWLGAPYFAFFRPLHALYVGYEEWARLGRHANLAPYYLIDAIR